MKLVLLCVSGQTIACPACLSYGGVRPRPEVRLDSQEEAASQCPPAPHPSLCARHEVGPVWGESPDPPLHLPPPSILPSTIYLQIKSQSQIIFYFALFWGWER